MLLQYYNWKSNQGAQNSRETEKVTLNTPLPTSFTRSIFIADRVEDRLFTLIYIYIINFILNLLPSVIGESGYFFRYLSSHTTLNRKFLFPHRPKARYICICCVRFSFPIKSLWMLFFPIKISSFVLCSDKYIEDSWASKSFVLYRGLISEK